MLDTPKTFQEIEFSAASPNVSLNVSADHSGFAKLDSLFPDDFTYSRLLEDGATEFVEGWVYLSPETSANLVVVPPAPLIEQMNVSMEIWFTAEPFVEPNDTLEMASITKPGETLRFRLMPRVDRDYFRIEIPTSGQLVLELIEGGGHPQLTPYWIDAEGNSFSVGSWGVPVEGGTAISFVILSHSYYWSEQAREEPLAVRVRLQRPDGSFVGETVLSGEQALLPGEHFIVPAGVKPPLIVLQPPQPGLYRLTGAENIATVAWSNLETGEVIEGNIHWLMPSTIYSIELLDVDPEAGDLRLGMQLKMRSLHDASGLYPRLPVPSGEALFGSHD